MLCLYGFDCFGLLWACTGFRMAYSPKVSVLYPHCAKASVFGSMWVCVDVARADGLRKGRKDRRKKEGMERNIIVLY